MVLVFLPAKKHLCKHFPGPPVLPVVISGQFRHILLCYVKPHFPGCAKHLPGCRRCLTAYIVFDAGKIITGIVKSIPQYMKVHTSERAVYLYAGNIPDSGPPGRLSALVVCPHTVMVRNGHDADAAHGALSHQLLRTEFAVITVIAVHV